MWPAWDAVSAHNSLRSHSQLTTVQIDGRSRTTGSRASNRPGRVTETLGRKRSKKLGPRNGYVPSAGGTTRTARDHGSHGEGSGRPYWISVTDRHGVESGSTSGDGVKLRLQWISGSLPSLISHLQVSRHSSFRIPAAKFYYYCARNGIFRSL